MSMSMSMRLGAGASQKLGTAKGLLGCCTWQARLPDLQFTAKCLDTTVVITEHKCEAVRRGLTETWDCKRAAALLHMAVPVSVRAEPRHWACALLCIASHGWQRDHKMDGWIRSVVLLTYLFEHVYALVHIFIVVCSSVCALLCVASYGWQRDHKVNCWKRYAGDALFSFSCIHVYLHMCMFLHTQYS